jgi:hypothetical protein
MGGAVVPQYRIFELDSEGHITTPPKIIDALDDQHALETAKQLKDGKVIEVWDGPRRIAEIK